MKTLLASVAAVALSAAAAEPPRTIVLEVEKMTCATCPLTVQQVLKRQSGVVEAKAEMKTASARVTFNPSKNSPEALARVVTEAGYPAKVRPVTAVILHSTLACPQCGGARREVMPTDACQFFYECPSCHALLRPKAGDCCVFCSYGDVKCPPVQQARACCG